MDAVRTSLEVRGENKGVVEEEKKTEARVNGVKPADRINKKKKKKTQRMQGFAEPP